MATLVTIDVEPEERALIEEHLPDAVWPGDGLSDVTGVLSLWPRSEWRKHGLSWEQLPSVEWLKVITAGVNHIGWDDIPERVHVMATPASTGPVIAEYALGAIIAWARGFWASTQAIQAGDFTVGRPVRAVSELRIGIVGHGGLGQAIAAAVQHHGASVRAVSRSGRAVNVEDVRTMDALPDLLAWADVLVLAVPLHKGTFGLIDEAALAAFGDGLLINVARGPVVDEDALFAWLSASPDARAAHLDVWWAYPRNGRPFHRPFHVLENVIMTPHNSPNVSGFRRRMLARALDDLDVVRSGRLLHVQDRDAHVLPSIGDGRT